MSADGGIGSVERALQLLEALLDGPMGTTALATRLGVSKATAFRLARTLQGRGYVVQLEDSRYVLGASCLPLATSALGNIDVRRELHWAEEELHDRTGETALLSVLVGRNSVCIDSIFSKQSVVSVATVVEVWPVHTCASGLAFLADDEELLDRYLGEKPEAATVRTPTDPEAIRKIVGEARVEGYSVNRGYWRDGVSAVGAVVHDATGKAVAALSVMMPEFRLEEAGVADLGSLVVDVAERASARLGFRGPKPASAR